MRISDWSSDVCSSDLLAIQRFHISQVAQEMAFGEKLSERELRGRIRRGIEMACNFAETCRQRERRHDKTETKRRTDRHVERANVDDAPRRIVVRHRWRCTPVELEVA